MFLVDGFGASAGPNSPYRDDEYDKRSNVIYSIIRVAGGLSAVFPVLPECMGTLKGGLSFWIK